jgi:hypothetical protein
MLRQGAGLTTLQVLFDQLDRSQKLLGKIMIDIIQSNFTPGKIQRIIEEQPTDQFYNKSFGRYDAAVEEGLNTTTQRQMQFAQLIQLREMGVPISTEDLLEASTMQGKAKIIENAQKQEQQQAQMQQQQAESAMQVQQAQIQDMQSRSKANEGLYNERTSRVMENESMAVERMHRANQDDSAALLNNVKVLKELESMDLSHLQQLISMASLLKQQEVAQSEQGLSKVASTPVESLDQGRPNLG